MERVLFRLLAGRRAGFLLLFLPVLCSAHAPQPVLVNSSVPSLGGGASGDSRFPLISSDGQYVVFASAANNLLSATNALSSAFPLNLNVYLRCRTNASTVLVSSSLDGAGGANGDSVPTGISTDNRYVLFESTADNLVTNDTRKRMNIFIRDVVTGTTTLVSVGTNGQSANGSSRSSTMTPDGRYVAFTSMANNLVAGDTNGFADVFVRDLATGTTTLASVGARHSFGTLGLPDESDSPDITPDGRYVAFYSTATNLVPGANNQLDIYIRDTIAGSTIWASAGARAMLRNIPLLCFGHCLSADGQCVAYTAGTNAPATGFNGVVLRYCVQTGTTTLISSNTYLPYGAPGAYRALDMTPDGTYVSFIARTVSGFNVSDNVFRWDGLLGVKTNVSAGATNGLFEAPMLNDTGSLVTFATSATNVTANPSTGEWRVYSRDLQSSSANLISADENQVGFAVDPWALPYTSSSGSVVVFETPESSLALNDHNRQADVFVRDAGLSGPELISSADSFHNLPGPNGSSMLGACSVSLDSRYIAFSSAADNLVDGDTNLFQDVFVRDTVAGTNIAVSVSTNGVLGDGISMDASISSDGRFVSFTSAADNLVPGDDNRTSDIFLRDLASGTTSLISVSTNGVSVGNRPSYGARLSAGESYILFLSTASNLATNPASTSEGLFLRNLQSSQTYKLASSLSSVIATSPGNGRFVLFSGLAPGYGLYLWDSQLNATVYTNTSSASFSSLGVSADGKRLVYAASGQLFAEDRALGTNWVIGLGSSSSRAVSTFTDDGRFVTWFAPMGTTNQTNQVFLYDFQLGTNVLVSRSFISGQPGNRESDAPCISSDGRFLAYRSAASDLVPGDTNDVPDVFLYDRVTGSTTLVSVNGLGSAPGNNRSFGPQFSPDARMLLFQSWASDLAANDFNHYADIFALSLSTSNAIAAFEVQIYQGPGPNRLPTLTWLAVPGVTYSVETKQALTDSGWQVADGQVAILGERAYFADLVPGTAQKFYRVIAH